MIRIYKKIWTNGHFFKNEIRYKKNIQIHFSKDNYDFFLREGLFSNKLNLFKKMWHFCKICFFRSSDQHSRCFLCWTNLHFNFDSNSPKMIRWQTVTFESKTSCIQTSIWLPVKIPSCHVNIGMRLVRKSSTFFAFRLSQ